MKFDKDKLREELINLKIAGWFEEFDIDNFIENIKDIEFTSPPKKDVFNAFKLFKPSKTKILILGQDPYPDNKKAHGLAFSVSNGKTDDSILNIFKAIETYNKCKKDIKDWGTNLEIWAKNNGILLLNTALTHENTDVKTIKKHQIVWEPFINTIIKKLINPDNNRKLVVFLWGKNAQCAFFNAIREMSKFEPDKCCLVRKMILMTSHPSNQGVRFGFSEDAPNHFKACDEFLFENDEEKYIWKNFPKNNQKNT